MGNHNDNPDRVPDGRQISESRHATRFACTIACAYILAGLLWIALSDRAIMAFIDDPAWLTKLQTAKGWFFIIVSGTLLWVLAFWRYRAEHRVERARQAATQNLEAVFDASPSAIVAVDEQGRVLLWNRAAARMFGWSADEVIGRPAPIIPEDEERNIERLREQILEGSNCRGHIFQRVRRDGTVLDVYISMAALRGSSGEVIGVVSVITDASEQRQVERLERERATLRETSSAMDRTLGVIGHELRTPLAGLKAMTEFLIDTPDREDEDEQARQFLESIHDEINRMTDMVNNMLEAARMNSVERRWKWGTVRLYDVCEDAMEILRPLAEKRGVTMSMSIRPSCCTLAGDSDAIRRLLLNLMSNALRHTGDGEVRVEAREASGPDHKWIQISVRDTGSGITPEVVGKLGHAFATGAGSVAPDATHGSGLGLAICREIVAVHGGQITVDSRANTGTTFTALLRADLTEPYDHEEPAPITHHNAA